VGRIADSNGTYSASSQHTTPSQNPFIVTLSLQAVVTLASSATVKLQGTSDTGGSSAKMLAATTLYGSGNNATRILAVKIAG
jgi:hypothetical protein